MWMACDFDYTNVLFPKNISQIMRSQWFVTGKHRWDKAWAMDGAERWMALSDSAILR